MGQTQPYIPANLCSASVFYNRFKGALTVKRINGVCSDVLQLPIGSSVSGDVTHTPAGGSARWRLQSASQSARPTTDRCVSPTPGARPPGIYCWEVASIWNHRNSSFHLVFPTCWSFFVCFFVWLLGLSFKSAIMSRTPEDVSKLTESTYKVREVHDFEKIYLVVIIVISIDSSK